MITRITRSIAALVVGAVLLTTGCGPAMVGFGVGDPYYRYRRPIGYFDVTFYPYNGYWYNDHVFYNDYWYWHGYDTPYYDYYWGSDPYWYY